jgi:hypothetical protein
MRYAGRILLTVVASFGCGVAWMPAWAQASRRGGPALVALDTAQGREPGTIQAWVLAPLTAGFPQPLGLADRKSAVQAVLLAKAPESMAWGATGAESGEGSQPGQQPEKSSAQGQENEWWRGVQAH